MSPYRPSLIGKPRAYASARNDEAPDEGTLLTIHGNLGILYVKMRLTEKAISAFEQVLTLDPSDRQARSILGRLKRS